MASLVKASIWLTLSELFFNISGYITHSVLGRFLGPADYGKYTLIITFSTMIIVLLGRGVPIAMSKYLSEHYKTSPEKIPFIKKTAAKIQFSIIFPLSLAYFFLAPFFAFLLKDASLTPLFRASTLIIPSFAMASFYIYYYNGLQKFDTSSLLKFFRGLFKIIFILSFGFWGKALGATFGHSISPFVVFAIAFILDPFKTKKGEKKKDCPEDKIHWKEIFGFAWPITLFMIFYEVMISIDLYMVKAILGDDDLTGFYSGALNIGRIPYFAFYFLSVILLPKVSELKATKEKEKLKDLMNRSMKFLLMLLIPGVFLISAFADPIVNIFYGKAFAPSGEPLSILSFGMGFLTIFYILAFVLNGAGNNKIPMYISIMGGIINSTLNYLLIKSMGINGAAIATTITSAIICFIAINYAQKEICNFIKIKSVSIYIGASFIIYEMAQLFFGGNNKILFILGSISLLGLYFLILKLFKELSLEDITFFKEALMKKKLKKKS